MDDVLNYLMRTLGIMACVALPCLTFMVLVFYLRVSRFLDVLELLIAENRTSNYEPARPPVANDFIPPHERWPSRPEILDDQREWEKERRADAGQD